MRKTRGTQTLASSSPGRLLSVLQVVCSGSCAPGCPKPLPAPASPLLGLCSGHAGWPLYGRVFAPFSHLLVMHPSPSTPPMHPP